MAQIMLKELIANLQKTYNEHGNLPVYQSDDAIISEARLFPEAKKNLFP